MVDEYATYHNHALKYIKSNITETQNKDLCFDFFGNNTDIYFYFSFFIDESNWVYYWKGE